MRKWIEEDIQEEWTGHYESADDALAVIQKEFAVPFKEIVLVQVEGGPSFSAEVEVNVDRLDPSNMPPQLAGVLTRLAVGIFFAREKKRAGP